MSHLVSLPSEMSSVLFQFRLTLLPMRNRVDLLKAEMINGFAYDFINLLIPPISVLPQREKVSVRINLYTH